MTVNIGYLIPHLRLVLGDIDSSKYRYETEWLNIALIASVKSLGRWWNNRYLVDDDDLIYRNPSIAFSQAEPPVILIQDERPIVLMAAIIVLEGSLENSTWSLVSWKDNEIAFSNLESGRIRDKSLSRLWDELVSLIVPPTKRLARSVKGRLPGYLNNPFEKVNGNF